MVLITCIQILAEIAMLLSAIWLLLPLPFLRSTPAPPPDTRLVLVFTWLHKNPLHWFWRWYLERRGIPTALLYVPLARVSISESAQELKRYLEEHDLRGVVLAGISTGGLTCLLYVRELDGWERARGVVTIASPLRGVHLACLDLLHANVRELVPGSGLLRRLEGGPAGNGGPIVCLAARHDQLVPARSSCLPGARRIVIDVWGHNVLHVLTRATYDQLAAVVREWLA